MIENGDFRPAPPGFVALYRRKGEVVRVPRENLSARAAPFDFDLPAFDPKWFEEMEPEAKPTGKTATVKMPDETTSRPVVGWLRREGGWVACVPGEGATVVSAASLPGFERVAALPPKVQVRFDAAETARDSLDVCRKFW